MKWPWLDMPEPKRFLVFPFPIEVIDKRSL